MTPSPRSTTQVTLEGKGPVTLKPSDHIATGGEGSIYKVAGMAVKMYLKPAEMRAAGLPAKIKLLSQLQHPYIGAPKGLVLNSSQEPVGHYLPFVDGHALSLVFTNDFWTKEGFDVAKSSELVSRMREVFDFAHDHGALLVDPNELNWFAVLPKSGDPEPRVIDVDSWVFENNIPSTVPKMPSIRDWHGKNASRESDWFAWGVVTFQIYTGIHPYKGGLDGFGRTDIEARMKANASVFSKGIKLNLAVRDFSTIPGPLRSWYEATFQKGSRSKPPAPGDKDATVAPAARVLRTVLVGGIGSLSFEKIFSLPNDPVIRTFFCGVVQTKSGALFELSTKRQITTARRDCAIVQTEDGWLVGDQDGFKFVRLDRVETPLSLNLEFRALVNYENRMFAVMGTGLSEIRVQMFGKPVASVSNTWGIMVNSTRWFDGVGVLDAMGAMFVVAIFDRDKVSSVRVKELDGMKIVAGKAGNRFISLIGVDRQGVYHKFELTFDREYALPPKVWQSVADDATLNLAILPKGVCATIFKDGQLDLFVPTSGAVRHVDDRQVATDMALSNWRDVVTFLQNGDVWTVKVK